MSLGPSTDAAMQLAIACLDFGSECDASFSALQSLRNGNEAVRMTGRVGFLDGGPTWVR